VPVTHDDVRRTVLRLLGEIAPEADLTGLDPDTPLRDALDLDSMDVLNLMVGLSEALGVDVPETDYPMLATLNACVDYLAARRDARA
jgi:acyl carrier protein